MIKFVSFIERITLKLHMMACPMLYNIKFRKPFYVVGLPERALLLKTNIFKFDCTKAITNKIFYHSSFWF